MAQTSVGDELTDGSRWSPSLGSTNPPPSPSPPQPLSLLPCSKLCRLSWASWCSCSMPGGRPAARKTFTGCCHGSLVGAVFLFSRSRLEVAAGGRERGQRRWGLHSLRVLLWDNTVPAQCPSHPSSLGMPGCGCVPPWQTAACWDQPSPLPPLWGLDAVPEGCQEGSWLKLGKEASPTTRA